MFQENDHFSENQASATTDSAVDVRGIIERMREAFGVYYNANLAKCLDIPKQTVSSWIIRGKVPYPHLMRASQMSGFSLDWLITGKGEKKSKATSTDAEEIARLRKIIAEQNVLIASQSAFIRQWQKQNSE